MEQLMINGQRIYRWEDLLIPAFEVEANDKMLGLSVHRSQKETNWIWEIAARGRDERGREVGVHIKVTDFHLVPVSRQVPVMRGECRICGREAKYRDLCAAHYQAQRRAARSVPGPGDDFHNVELPFSS